MSFGFIKFIQNKKNLFMLPLHLVMEKPQHLPRKKTQLIHYTLMHFQNIKENNYVFIGIKFIGYQLIQLEFLTLMVQDQELQELMELYLVYF